VNRVCILGTNHIYQFKTKRQGYLQLVGSLIRIHAVDFVGEEAQKTVTFAHAIADKEKALWKNVDLNTTERELLSCPDPWGTQINLDKAVFREWVWLVRTAMAMKQSALLICGCAHTTGISSKFQSVGFEVETHAFVDLADHALIVSRVEE
jgi:hypothetical protein